MDGVFTSILRQCNNYKVSYSPSTFYTSDIPIIQIFSSHSFGPLLNLMIWFIKNWLAKVHNQGEEKCSQLSHRCTMYIDYTQYSGKQKPPTLAWHDDNLFSKCCEQHQCTMMSKLENSSGQRSEQWAWRGGTVMVTNDWRLSPGHHHITSLLQLPPALGHQHSILWGRRLEVRGQGQNRASQKAEMGNHNLSTFEYLNGAIFIVCGVRVVCWVQGALTLGGGWHALIILLVSLHLQWIGSTENMFYCTAK